MKLIDILWYNLYAPDTALYQWIFILAHTNLSRSDLRHDAE
jgi:hypothetical protein